MHQSVHANNPIQSEEEEALQVWRALEWVLSYLTLCEFSLLLKLQKVEVNTEHGPLSWWWTKAFYDLSVM